MSGIYITSSSMTKFDIVTRDIRDTAARTRAGCSNTVRAMHALLDDACINTNDTFEENGRTEVSLEDWNREFTRNVEFLMGAGDYDTVAVGNLKHYGFRP